MIFFLKIIYLCKKKILTRLRDWCIKYKKEKLFYLPLSVAIEMTTRCNQQCIICHGHSKGTKKGSFYRGEQGGSSFNEDIVRNGGFIKEHIFRNALILAKHSYSINLTGFGESTAHPKFKEFLILARKKNPCTYIFFISNGQLIDDELIDIIFEQNINGITFSVNAYSPKTYVSIHKTGTIEKIFSVIEKIYKRKKKLNRNRCDLPKISINFVIMRMNIKELPDLVSFAVKNELTAFAAYHISHCGKKDSEIYKDQFILNHPALLSENFNKAKMIADGSLSLALPNILKNNLTDEKRKSRMDISEKEIKREQNNLCKDFFEYLSITYNGDVMPCCLEQWFSEPIGNIMRDKPYDIWNGKVMRRLRREYFNSGIMHLCPGCSRINPHLHKR